MVVALDIGFLRRGPSFVGMTILGGCFGMGDLFLTQGALLCRDDNFGGGCFWNGGLVSYAEVPPSSG